MIKGLLKPAESKGKLAKTIKADKFISNPKEKDKGGSALAKTGVSSIVARPSTKIVSSVSLPSVKETKPPKGKVGFDYLNNLLDTLVKNTSALLKISKSEYKSEVKNSDADRRQDQLNKKKEREETAETRNRVKGERSNLKIAAPKLPLFDSAFEFLKRFALGTGVMYLLSILSDPEKKDSLIGFLTNNMQTIILATVGIMGALMLAPLVPVLGAFTTLLTITASLIGSLVSLIVFNPPVLAAVGALLGTAVIIGATAAPAGQNSQITGPNAVWKDPRLDPSSRKAIIESTFDHMPYSTWPQDAKELYEQALRDLGISLKDQQDKLRQKVTQHSQQRTQIQQMSLNIPQPSLTSPAASPAATPVSSPSQPTSTLIPQSRLPALPPTGTGHKSLAAAQQYGAYRTGGRRHAGQDFDAGPNDTFYSRIGGVVTLVDYDSGGYYNYVDIYNSDLNVTERIAEGDQVLVKKGQTVSAGTPVAKGTNTTGVFHYEIRTGKKTTYGFSGTKNPLEFLNGVQSRNPTQIAQQPAPAPAAAVSQYATYEEPAGTPALTPIPIPQQSNPPQVASGSGSMVSSPVSKFQVLNTYYNFQVLGFLYKQG